MDYKTSYRSKISKHPSPRSPDSKQTEDEQHPFWHCKSAKSPINLSVYWAIRKIRPIYC